MNQKILNRIAGVSVLVLALLMGIVISKGIQADKSNKEAVAGISILRECPDEWIVNKMPGVIDSTSREEYFIVKGDRQETAKYDYAWVMANCNLQPTEVF
jgi:hypothetical protein